eukprot:1680506-Amphidinium_carterae.2
MTWWSPKRACDDMYEGVGGVRFFSADNAGGTVLQLSMILMHLMVEALAIVGHLQWSLKVAQVSTDTNDEWHDT